MTLSHLVERGSSTDYKKDVHGLWAAKAAFFSVEPTTPTASSVFDRRFAFQRPATKRTARPNAATKSRSIASNAQSFTPQDKSLLRRSCVP